MTDSFVTRCPHCDTRLRVTDEQISIAAGVVRCGTCLQTFNAHDHLLGGSPTPKADKADEMDELLIHDDLDLRDLGLDDLNLDEELAQIEAQEQAFSKELFNISKQIQGSDIQPIKSAQADESWAEALLDEEEKVNPAPSLSGNDAPSKEDALWLPYKKSREEKPLKKPLKKPSIDWDNIAVIDNNAPDVPVSLSFPPPKRHKAPPAKVKINLKGLVEEKNKEDEEPVFEPPLRLRKRRSLKPIFWGTASVLAVFAMVAQYAFFNFDNLAHQERYRPWFATICPLIGCTLPNQASLGQIRSNNLVVRSHPQFDEVLMVNVILYNQAEFAQSFPLLELKFSNVAGRLVARRRFTPEQYLPSDMQGKQQMLPQVPIHIALEIQDPGNEAVNYSLAVLPYQ